MKKFEKLSRIVILLDTLPHMCYINQYIFTSVQCFPFKSPTWAISLRTKLADFGALDISTTISRKFERMVVMCLAHNPQS